ncbi:branched-chain amino acid transport system ATP-binding protein [Hamadaea flava]|uniref:ATP-binding cassette domain-containing protein n=1 Tax=Hamadaea flava TaxID=1742688 RepID=A0ABV8LJH2_9ACTN|nr:ATP-binding cassette domain-containing protein [Hamadaea flava]MCP2323565.1 branched-chain amino acid transport system ATP-binding protein [Hamadaea flava]
MLTLDQVTFGHTTKQLRQVTFTLPDGTMALLNGPAGAGKSLLLSTIAGHTTVDAGTITIAGRDVTSWQTVRRTQFVAYAPQRHRVWPTMTVADHLHLAWPMSRARRTTRAHVLDLFPPLADRLRQPAELLSTTEARMLTLAVTLLRNKRLLLLDEPCHGLPHDIGQRLAGHLLRLKDLGTTILTVDSTCTLDRPTVVLTADSQTITIGEPATVRARR